MRVVFVSPHCDPEADLGEPDAGGQCLYEYQLGQALSHLPRTEVDVYCRQTFKRPDMSQVNPHFRIHRLHCGPDTFIPKEEIEPYLPLFAQQVVARLSQSGTTVVHAHYWDGGKAALLLKALAKQSLPLVWTPHSLGSQKRRKFPGRMNESTYNFISRLCWENYTSFCAQKVIVSSNPEKNDLLDDYCLDYERIEIIPPGVAVGPKTKLTPLSLRRKHALPLRAKILLTLGRMTPAKGYHHAIEALARLKQMYVHPVYLVIVGGSQERPSLEEEQYLTELRQLAAQLQVSDAVIFRPAVKHDHIHEWYLMADVVLVFSEHEPFGLTVVEAMAMRKPVAATKAGGPTALITQNQTGVLVDVTKLERAAYYLKSLLQDSHLVAKITDQAYEQIAKHFNWQNRAREFRKVYQSVSRYDDHLFQEWLENKYFFSYNLKADYAVLH